ncbi:MutS-related protein [Flavobacterium litorale]|uniref:DNA mismatch repair proteins mutS family domain-containing protein n=1 Tax=Flavobacterium litorale TaxID=2856519 RepID=A0ABX8VA11_9FLAO|nr:hypothetical protein [Flavobacterium litorale]QYJ67481.1 hypothetical protein K1I41_07915 [Flavobacterium litorale]
MQVKDLNINTDIFELFNSTWNEDAKAKVKEMVITPLITKEEVISRQLILKGFLSNISVFKDYSYSKIDFREVNYFMQKYTDKEYLPKRLSLKLLLSKKKYYRYKSHCIQVIFLYHRLHNLYVKKLNLAEFPESYKDDIRTIDNFFNSLRLDYHEELIRDGNFKIKDIKRFIMIISERKKRDEIALFQKKFTELEAYISISLGINICKFTFPKITNEKFYLEEFYHPLLKKPVKNSIKAFSNVNLLTGPNMSGKSTLLKAIGICVYLANIGFAIPARVAQIPKYGNISVFINLNDDLQSGYSHFMTEVINLKKVITVAKNKKCFAVFDELFRGTNIDDALEISGTTLKGMLNFPDSMFFVSSHLHQLVTYPEISNDTISCYYLECDLKNDVPTFVYTLKPGWSDIKIGRILFEKEGLNEYLLNK